jgi:hypothetical protein
MLSNVKFWPTLDPKSLMRDIYIDTHNKYICNILKRKTIENISTLIIFNFFLISYLFFHKLISLMKSSQLLVTKVE